MKKTIYSLVMLSILVAMPASVLANTTFTTVCNDKGECKTSLKTPPVAPQKSFRVANVKKYNLFKGRIIRIPERYNEMYYVDADSMRVYRLDSYDKAFEFLLKRGHSTSNANLAKIQVGILGMYGIDTDKDGLSDRFEDAVGTNLRNFNTDNDTYSDFWEVKNGFNPIGAGKYPLNIKYAKQQTGKILLQTERSGEAWYVNPSNNKRYFLGTKYDANDVLKKLSIKISNADFNSLIK